VARACDTLIAASREVGAIAIQNRGTIGGNVANASPAADTVPVLVAMGATLVLASAEGRREVPIGRFYLGYKKLDLRGDELLVAVRVPRRRDGEVLWFRKVGTRRAQSISKVVLAGRARPRYGPGGACVLESLSLAAGSVGPTVLALRGAEAAAIGRPLDDDALRQIRTAVGNDVTPIDDVRSTSEYRRTVAENLVVRWLGELRKAGVAKGSA
jgi:CO/xanthine dehydrogenase FAD-binding subunit